MEKAIDAGAEDVIVEEEGYTIITEPGNFHEILEVMNDLNIPIIEHLITMVPKNKVPLNKVKVEKVHKLVDLLDDLQDVQSVSSNEELVIE